MTNCFGCQIVTGFTVTNSLPCKIVINPKTLQAFRPKGTNGKLRCVSDCYWLRLLRAHLLLCRLL